MVICDDIEVVEVVVLTVDTFQLLILNYYKLEV